MIDLDTTHQAGWVLFFFSIIGIIIGIIGFIRGFRSFLLKRLIENIPTSKIRSAAMGLVELYGEVIPIKTLNAPLSGERCVYYRLDIENPPSDKPEISDIISQKYGWKKLESIEDCQLFWLKDETGKILIDPSQTKVKMEYTHRCQSGRGNPLPKETMDFLKSRGSDYKDFFGRDAPLRYIEYLIRPGDKVYVLGSACKNPEKSFPKDSAESMIVCKNKDSIYYISNKSEKETLSHLGRTAIFGIFSGISLIALCSAFAIFLYLYLIYNVLI